MKCLIKVGLVVYSMCSILLLLVLPLAAHLLAKFGPSWCMVINKAGETTLGTGVEVSLFFLGTFMLVSGVVSLCAAIEMRCE